MGFYTWLRDLGITDAPQIAGLKPARYKRAGSFSATGQVVSVPGGTSTQPGKVVLAQRVVPSGCAIEMESWSAAVIDIGNSNQIYFALTRNGVPIGSNLARVPGEVFNNQAILDIKEAVYAGVIEVIAYNISGMSTSIEPDAIAVATPVRCQAWFTGTLLSERGGL